MEKVLRSELTIVALEMFIEYSAGPLMRLVCRPYCSDPEAVASGKSKDLIPQRFVELLQWNSEFAYTFDLKKGDFVYRTHRSSSFILR